ncbi:hypothetical protein [Novosphingobium marinum]|uniref:Uncharacterized protein n=1 Tax=Novosphingobium marinum TaxID=1514948 RepID=A0A7Y9Y1W7_9SPHN|nr:hypothetical protein [Novosphingobium marinum]NYH97213.1 hypothetical protein [Novosphingobium marinum]
MGDSEPVVSFHTSIGSRWIPPFSFDGLFHRKLLNAKVKQLRDQPLHWSWARSSDWPRQRMIGSDFQHAREGGFGFVVEVATDRIFLVPRGWEEPEWGLASYDLERERWRDLGDFEPAPEHWIFPEAKERASP